jgi:hypothetical protein
MLTDVPNLIRFSLFSIWFAHFLIPFDPADLLTHSAHLLSAMAPKGLRHHPYRAISNVETSGGTQTCSWYAGPGGQPAGNDPPPDRPVLI